MLSRRQTIDEHRRNARQAMGSYALDLECASLRFISDDENVTFRVEEAGSSASADRFLLRIHRVGRDLRIGDYSSAIRSELAWLKDLRASTALSVPEPVATRTGEPLAYVECVAADDPRICTLLRWMDGRTYAGLPQPSRLRQIGAAMAQMHLFASDWAPPEPFVRGRWDWEAFFGDTMSFGGLGAASVRRLLPRRLEEFSLQLADFAGAAMDHLGLEYDQFGLIHADLHLRNVLFWRDEIRIIDFDDLGYGLWTYDMAVTLCELRFRDNYDTLKSAFFEGYARYRSLPAQALDYMDVFIAVRLVWLSLWYTGHAQFVSAIRARLDTVHDEVTRSLEKLDLW